MATTTPLNGWPVPTSTDYVKDGATAIESLGDAIDASVGSGLLAWTSYTPTLYGMTLGNGSLDFKYAKIGKTVHVRGSMVVGSTSANTGGKGFSLPFAPNFSGYIYPNLGAGMYYAGGALFPSSNLLVTGSQVYVVVGTTSGAYLTTIDITGSVPAAWASGNQFQLCLTYETSA